MFRDCLMIQSFDPFTNVPIWVTCTTTWLTFPEYSRVGPLLLWPLNVITLSGSFNARHNFLHHHCKQKYKIAIRLYLNWYIVCMQLSSNSALRLSSNGLMIIILHAHPNYISYIRAYWVRNARRETIFSVGQLVTLMNSYRKQGKIHWAKLSCLFCGFQQYRKSFLWIFIYIIQALYNDIV